MWRQFGLRHVTDNLVQTVAKVEPPPDIPEATTDRAFRWPYKGFDFATPHNMDVWAAKVAQVQAQAVLKANKFFVSCPWTLLPLRELRFYSRNVSDKLCLQARFLSSDELYPVLQPWVRLPNRKEVMFYGARNRPIFDNARDLVHIMRQSAEKVPLPDGRVFALGMRNKAPVLRIHMMYPDGGLGALCAGAVSRQRLEEFVKDLEAGFDPFHIDDYLDFLGL